MVENLWNTKKIFYLKKTEKLLASYYPSPSEIQLNTSLDGREATKDKPTFSLIISFFL